MDNTTHTYVHIHTYIHDIHVYIYIYTLYLRLAGKVVVDDIIEQRDVNATRSNVSHHENAAAAGAKLSHTDLACY